MCAGCEQVAGRVRNEIPGSFSGHFADAKRTNAALAEVKLTTDMHKFISFKPVTRVGSLSPKAGT